MDYPTWVLVFQPISINVLYKVMLENCMSHDNPTYEGKQVNPNLRRSIRGQQQQKCASEKLDYSMIKL